VTNFGIANILYDLATDMDYADYEETRDKEIEKIKKELDSIENTTLYKLLEEIVRKEI
jgi:hypothetical protein